MKLYISMYHYIRDLRHSRYPNIKGMDISLFRKQQDFFRSNFNVVRMEQVIEATGGVLRYLKKPFYLHLMMDILIILHMYCRFWKNLGCRVPFSFQEKPLLHINCWM